MVIALMFGFHINEKNFLDGISTCYSLLTYYEKYQLLKQIVMGNEEWILYSDVEQKSSWGKQSEPSPTTPMALLHPKQMMLVYGGIEKESSIMSSFWKSND